VLRGNVEKEEITNPSGSVGVAEIPPEIVLEKIKLESSAAPQTKQSVIVFVEMHSARDILKSAP
jgi:hypothetical protein